MSFFTSNEKRYLVKFEIEGHEGAANTVAISEEDAENRVLTMHKDKKVTFTGTQGI